MLIYVNITDGQADKQTDKHIKIIVRNLTKSKLILNPYRKIKKKFL